MGTGLEIRVGMGVLSAFYSSQSRSSEDSHEVMVVSQWGPQTGKVTGPGEALCTETGKQLNGSQGEEEAEEGLRSELWD